MSTFWFGAAALTLLAVAFLLVPLWRESRAGTKLTPIAPLAALAVIPVSVALYFVVTTYDPDAPAAVSNSDLAMLEALAARLNEQPDDVEGWILLGRSYRTLGDYQHARTAFEQAWTRTAAPSSQLKLLYAESMLFTEPGTAMGMAGDLVEDVLQSLPNDQMALFYGALVATERNNASVAVDRYTHLLSTNPPPEIVEIIQAQLIALTGQAAPAAALAATPQAAPAGPVIELDVSVGEGVDLSGFGPGARLYLLARGPDMPLPLAAQQLPVASLPGHFVLSDADNPMGAVNGGRSLAQYDTVTVVARLSASGGANSQSGDVFGEATVAPGSGEPVSIVIDQVVP